MHDPQSGEARKLGFVFDPISQKWGHHDFPNYRALRAKYAIKDYPILCEQRALAHVYERGGRRTA